ncbi:MAG TPA: HAMP domain-containing histidine kinase [Candidatus Merdivicinus intestinigallinarum]|nr:HAMP domain-containing histidine kinase [Candidatus Merdivicinus intestinigallinarum]
MKSTKSAVRQSHFPGSLCVVYFVSLLLMSGVHMGLVTLINTKGWNDIVAVLIPTVYWALVAVALTLYARWQIKKTYEEPMHRLAKATAKVAQGDFSVYVPPLHTADKLDYLDVMILDFNTMVEELGSIETLKTDFFSNVSHEMKTPLAVIQNYAQLLQKENLTEEERREYADSILQSTRKLSSLITNILKLNKLEKQTIRPVPEQYDLCQQLCDCALQFEDAWEKKDIEFIAELEDRAIIEADPGLLELVWTNLLSNAVKFTPPGGTVTLTQTSDEKEITVSVSDTGCGMDEKTLRHIYDKFYQGDTSHSTEGNGLGLALVQRILQLSNGTITVKSRVGQGSTFTVRLPAPIHREEISQ